ncbi:MAG TPA: class I SAM-dependent methyltransferase [Verrucomicrobiae bacterium]|jgi:SAM-dependent methyltransferase
MSENAQELQRIYRQRFSGTSAYRNRVWQVLTNTFFCRWIPSSAAVLDLGCGYGEFINNIAAGEKYAMDLNPDAPKHLLPAVHFLEQDCSTQWPLPEDRLDAVFTSNFFEHLPDKECLKRTLRQAFRCLKPGGSLIAMGPNIKYLPGLYWDFFDHHTILTEASLGEVLEMEGFVLKQVTPRFLPYTLVNAPEYPLIFLRLYLAMPWLWWMKGRQFLVIATKPC